MRTMPPLLTKNREMPLSLRLESAEPDVNEVTPSLPVEEMLAFLSPEVFTPLQDLTTCAGEPGKALRIGLSRQNLSRQPRPHPL